MPPTEIKQASSFETLIQKRPRANVKKSDPSIYDFKSNIVRIFPNQKKEFKRTSKQTYEHIMQTPMKMTIKSSGTVEHKEKTPAR